jgi:hypothetical protein
MFAVHSRLVKYVVHSSKVKEKNIKFMFLYTSCPNSNLEVSTFKEFQKLLCLKKKKPTQTCPNYSPNKVTPINL